LLNINQKLLISKQRFKSNSISPARQMEEKEEKIKKSLKFSIFDGAFYWMMVGFGESFLAAFAVFLKATNVQLGLLSSLPKALGSLSQLFSNNLLKFFKSRKKIVCIGVFLQAFMYIPIALVFFFGEFSIPILIVFVCLYWIFGAIGGPAWSSWMGDLVSEHKRGDYFGNRNKIGSFVSFLSLLAAGYILQRFSTGNFMEYVGFCIIFSIAIVSRFISFFYLTKQYEPEYVFEPKSHFSFIQFLKQARFTNYGLFVFYLSLMNLGIYIAAPFFTPYMLYDLKLSYTLFTILTATAMIVKFMMMPIWGNLCDKYGTKKVLTISGFLMPAIPLLWTLSTNINYLIFVQIFAGFSWAGFDIASFNFIFDTTKPSKRATCVAYYKVLKGLAIFIGAMAGGLMVNYNSFFWSKYYLVFIISFVIRYFASFLLLPKLKEIRMVEAISHRKLLMKALTTRPSIGLVSTIMTFRRNNHKKILMKPSFKFKFSIFQKKQKR